MDGVKWYRSGNSYASEGGASKQLRKSFRVKHRLSASVKWVGGTGKMKTRTERKWMWMFLAVVVSLQVYFVWNASGFALFAAGFAPCFCDRSFVHAAQRFGHWQWIRIADSRTRMLATRQGINTSKTGAQAFGVRVLRRPLVFTTFLPWPGAHAEHVTYSSE